MTPVEHAVRAIKQNTSECMQTAAAQMLSFYDNAIEPWQILAEVPVHLDTSGEKVGTSPGHLAAYCAQKGYVTTAYIFDVELFDRSWQGMDSAQIVQNLRRRQTHIPTNAWLSKYHHIVVEGWESFQQAGGAFVFPQLNAHLLRHLLDDGPYILMINSTYLNNGVKGVYDQTTDRFIDDSIKGRSFTHATTCAGYKDGQFLIVDPDPPEGLDQHRWIDSDHLIASIMAAQTESINLLISVSRP